VFKSYHKASDTPIIDHEDQKDFYPDKKISLNSASKAELFNDELKLLIEEITLEEKSVVTTFKSKEKEPKNNLKYPNFSSSILLLPPLLWFLDKAKFIYIYEKLYILLAKKSL
jgi:hypothetical protein